MESVMCLHFGMQEDDIHEHTNICQASIVYTLSQLVVHCVTQPYTSNIIEHSHTKILESTLECQVSQGDNNDEVDDLGVTQHMPQNRVSDTIIIHVMLNTINGVVHTDIVCKILPSNVNLNYLPYLG